MRSAFSTSSSEQLLLALEDAVGGARGALVTDADDMAPYGRDWLGQYGERPMAVVRPASTAEVSAVVSACARAGVPVVPQGGNTGLVGGGVPMEADREVVLSLDRMRSIRGFDEDSGVVTVEAGCVLGTVDKMLREEHGRCMPVDLGAKGSCTVGGNLATAAGGVHVVRWGTLHASVVGVEAVLADGTVVDGLRTALKSNAGYHWPHLLVGSEGTLGIITAATVRTPPAPAARTVALLGFGSWGGLRSAVRRAMGPSGLAETISAVEYLDSAAVDVAVRWGGQKDPLDERYPFVLLLEAAGASAAYCGERMEDVAMRSLASDDAITAVIASTGAQEDAVWGLREGVTEALSRRGQALKFDVSLPLARMAGPDGAVRATRRRLEEELPGGWMSRGFVPEGSGAESPAGRGWGSGGEDAGGVLVCGYGHVGDGNLHLNVSVPSDGDGGLLAPEARGPATLHDAVDAAKGATIPWLPEWVAAEGGRAGSVSAEHGVGVSKLSYASLSRGRGEEDLMRRLKAALDPRGTLLPGRVLGTE